MHACAHARTHLGVHVVQQVRCARLQQAAHDAQRRGEHGRGGHAIRDAQRTRRGGVLQGWRTARRGLHVGRQQPLQVLDLRSAHMRIHVRVCACAHVVPESTLCAQPPRGLDLCSAHVCEHAPAHGAGGARYMHCCFRCWMREARTHKCTCVLPQGCSTLASCSPWAPVESWPTSGSPMLAHPPQPI